MLPNRSQHFQVQTFVKTWTGGRSYNIVHHAVGMKRIYVVVFQTAYQSLELITTQKVQLNPSILHICDW